jgi:hypothetical protein
MKREVTQMATPINYKELTQDHVTYSVTTAETGRLSELMAIQALVRNGYEVAEPTVTSAHDLVIRRPGKRHYERAQVKTVYVRSDRGGALVVCGAKNSGKPYSIEEADVIIGVDRFDVYVIENASQREYWAQNERIAAGKWTKLSLFA